MVQTMVEKGMATIPDDPAQSAMFSAMLMPLHQTPMDPMEIAVRTLTAPRAHLPSSSARLGIFRSHAEAIPQRH